MSAFVPFKIYGIIGCPLGQSMSPLLHTTGFKELNIPAVLVPWELKAEDLGPFMQAFRLLDIQGACVTIPHKQNIIPLLDEVGERVKAVGAANTIYRKDGKIHGENTDVSGFLDPLRNLSLPTRAKVLLLGSGGAARAAAAGLQELGMENIFVTGRTASSAAKLAEAFNLDQVSWEKRPEVCPDLIINTTPLGMRGKFAGETPYQAEWFGGPKGLVYDLVYSPLETRFLKEAREAGWRTIDGLAMFLGQARQQFLLWTGQELPEKARQAVTEALYS